MCYDTRGPQPAYPRGGRLNQREHTLPLSVLLLIVVHTSSSHTPPLALTLPLPLLLHMHAYYSHSSRTVLHLHVRVVQVERARNSVERAWFQRLKLKFYKLVSTFAIHVASHRSTLFTLFAQLYFHHEMYHTSPCARPLSNPLSDTLCRSTGRFCTVGTL
jgi:hypothetical protein